MSVTVGPDLREDRRPRRRGDAAHEDLAVADVGDLVRPTARRARGPRRRRAKPAAPFSSVPPSCWRAHSCTRSVVTPHSMIVIGSVIASGVTPSAGGGVHSASRSRSLLAACDDRRPVLGPERLAAGRPRQHELVERGGDLVARELEDVLAVLEETVLGEQRAELTDLVPPPRQEPVVAEELVLLDVGEHRARQGQQLVRTARGSPRRAAPRTRRPAGRARAGSLRSAGRSARPARSAAMCPISDAYGMLGSSSQLR